MKYPNLQLACILLSVINRVHVMDVPLPEATQSTSNQQLILKSFIAAELPGCRQQIYFDELLRFVQTSHREITSEWQKNKPNTHQLRNQGVWHKNRLCMVNLTSLGGPLKRYFSSKVGKEVEIRRDISVTPPVNNIPYPQNVAPPCVLGCQVHSLALLSAMVHVKKMNDEAHRTYTMIHRHYLHSLDSACSHRMAELFLEFIKSKQAPLDTCLTVLDVAIFHPFAERCYKPGILIDALKKRAALPDENEQNILLNKLLNFELLCEGGCQLLCRALYEAFNAVDAERTVPSNLVYEIQHHLKNGINPADQSTWTMSNNNPYVACVIPGNIKRLTFLLKQLQQAREPGSFAPLLQQFLILALKQRSIDAKITKLLFDFGASPHHPPSLLLDVIARGDERILGQFLSQEAFHRYAAHQACQRGKPSILEELLKRRFPMDEPDEKGNSPLDYALEARADDCAFLLVRYGLPPPDYLPLRLSSDIEDVFTHHARQPNNPDELVSYVSKELYPEIMRLRIALERRDPQIDMRQLEKSILAFEARFEHKLQPNEIT